MNPRKVIAVVVALAVIMLACYLWYDYHKAPEITYDIDYEAGTITFLPASEDVTITKIREAHNKEILIADENVENCYHVLKAGAANLVVTFRNERYTEILEVTIDVLPDGAIIITEGF
jgi:hypothetical protein